MVTSALRTLVVDDEEGIRFFLGETLRQAGYTVSTASSGEEALDLLKRDSFELVVLDLMLGGRVDGQRVLEAVRWVWPEAVVVILTAHGSLESALAAIDEGVDGYLLKPARGEEVLRTLETALKRRAQRGHLAAVPEPTHLLEQGPFSFDLSAQQLTLRGQPVGLTLHEARLLVHLMRHAGQAISAEELVRAVLQYEADSVQEARRAIKWYVHCLRRKVEPDSSKPCYILNVRGVGYMFEA
jgi:DNA-binding response OmpR family regulator